MTILSTFGIYILFILAFVGTVRFLTNFSNKAPIKVEVKKEGQNFDNKIEEVAYKKTIHVLAKGCGCGSVIYGLLFVYIIDPIAIFCAIKNDVGNFYIACAMAVIVTINWAYRYKQFRKMRIFMADITSKALTDGDDATDDGTVASEKKNQYTGIKNPFVYAIVHIIFALPDLYLWYLFLIAIEAIK